MLNELKVRVDELSVNFNSIKKDMKTTEKNQSEIYTPTEIKNLQKIKSRVVETESNQRFGI